MCRGVSFICFALFSFNIFPIIIHFVNILGTTFSIKTGIFTITRRTKKGRKAHGGIAAFYFAGQNPRTGKISPFFSSPFARWFLRRECSPQYFHPFETSGKTNLKRAPRQEAVKKQVFLFERTDLPKILWFVPGFSGRFFESARKQPEARAFARASG